MKNAETRITEIRDALRCAGKSSLPKPLADHLALVAHANAQLSPFSQHANPDPIGIAARLAETTSPADFEAVLEAASAALVRYEALKAANAGGLRHQLEAAALRAVNEALPDVRKAVASTFTKAATALTEAAQSLPAGKAALNAEAVLNEDAGGAYSVARDALATITTLAAVFEAVPATDGTTPAPLLALLPAVNLPTTTPREVSNMSSRVVNDSADNQAVRAFAKAASDDPRLVLLDVARGKYAGLSLSLAEDTAEVARRVKAAQLSQLTKAVHTTNANATVVMR